jgi:hypothetical protein
MRLELGDEQHHDTRMVLAIARIHPDRTYDLVRAMDLANPSEVDAEIKNGSIYIRSATAHHGLYAVVYQFKPAGNGFRLVGLERQSITADESGQAAGHIELWEGVSADLVNAKATYWAQSFDLNSPKGQKAWETALQWHRQGRASPGGSRQQVRLKLRRPWILQQFSIDAFDASFLCHHFDYRLTFHSLCR